MVLTASGGAIPYVYDNFSDPAHRSIVQTSGTSQGYITYIPDIGYTGADSFTFEVMDNTATTSIGTVTVNITTNIVNIPDGNVNVLVNAITAANISGVPTAINLTSDSIYSLSDTDLLPVITSEMVIYGNGATIQRQSGTYPLFSAGNGGQLTLDQLTLSYGLTALQNNGGTILVTRSTITNMSSRG